MARLETRGLVTREPDPADRRGRVITRTLAGEDLNERFEGAFDFGRDAVQRLSHSEQDQLTALLRKALG